MCKARGPKHAENRNSIQPCKSSVKIIKLILKRAVTLNSFDTKKKQFVKNCFFNSCFSFLKIFESTFHWRSRDRCGFHFGFLPDKGVIVELIRQLRDTPPRVLSYL